LLELVRRSAEEVVPDTVKRRQRETAITAILERTSGVGVSHLARVLARTGLSTETIGSHASLLVGNRDLLAGVIDKIYTFTRATLTIRDASSNIARIVDGLKQYSHLDRAAMVTEDIHQGLQTTLEVMHSRIPPSVNVVTRFGNVPPFPHRPGELMQVWTNLLDNALTAMDETGTLSIETCRDGDLAVVRIRDSGTGIPLELRDRIFDLDITSRGPGAGLGLGLPICRSIVEENHGGSITFESEPGRTEFTVRLPMGPRCSGQPR
jgi:signal transduction histidine kinase